jgi:hypothetical protein
MTMRAREVLADCERALVDYQAGAKTVYQRPRWVAVMALLRTVGLVLKAADRKSADDATKRRIDEAWEGLNREKTPVREPHLFHDFIDRERYEVVHRYDVGAQVNVTIQLGGVSTGKAGSTPAGPATFDFVMRRGRFSGRDSIELAQEAIQFWRDYLNEIDARR